MFTLHCPGGKQTKAPDTYDSVTMETVVTGTTGVDSGEVTAEYTVSTFEVHPPLYVRVPSGPFRNA